MPGSTFDLVSPFLVTGIVDISQNDRLASAIPPSLVPEACCHPLINSMRPFSTSLSHYNDKKLCLNEELILSFP